MTSATFRHQSAPLLVGVGKAVFSGDDVYRYRLARIWGEGGQHAAWIMLNPSTADALTDDPTIRRCVRFTRAWGLDGLTVVNLFALRATDPAELVGHADPVGPANDQMISEALADAAVLVAAWGAHPMAAGRVTAVTALVPPGARLQCLGTTKAGHPRHPLYVSTRQPLVPWELSR
jgi:hypothetical protein